VVGGKVTQGSPFDGLVSFFPFATHLPTAEWLEFDVRDADGNVQHYERVVKDTAGYAARHGGGVVTVASNGDTPFITPLDSLSTLFAPGEVSVTTVSQHVIQAVRDQSLAVQTFAQYNAAPPNSPNRAATASALQAIESQYFRDVEAVNDLEFYHYFDTLAHTISTGFLSRAYADSPRIVSVGTDASSQAISPTISLSMDIIHNTARPVVSAREDARATISANMGLGFANGIAEYFVMQSESPTSPSVSVVSVFDQAQAQGVQFTQIDQAHLATLARLPLSNEARARITAAVQRGQVVVTPEQMVTVGSVTTVGWYEINRSTGEITDTMENGRHQSLAEYALILGLGILGQGAINALFICATNSSGGGGDQYDQALEFIMRHVIVAIIIVAVFIAAPEFLPAEIAAIGSLKVAIDLGAVVGGYLLADLIGLLGNLCPAPRAASAGAYVSTSARQRLHRVFPAASSKNSSAAATEYRSSDISPSFTVVNRHPLSDYLLNLSSPTTPLSAVSSSTISIRRNSTMLSHFSIDAAYMALLGNISSSWPLVGQHSVLFQTLDAPDANLYDQQGHFLDTGAHATGNDGEGTAFVSGSASVTMTGTGKLTYYSNMQVPSAASSTWASYKGLISTTTPFSMSLHRAVITSTQEIYTVPVQLSVPDDVQLSGTGSTLAPTFSITGTLAVSDGGILIGPVKASTNSPPFDPSSSFALVDYSGPLTVTHATGNTDQVELANSADYFAVHTAPATSTTDATAPVTFRAAIDSSADDTYTTTVEAPDGWNVALDATGLVTATPPLGAESGDYTILVTVQSGSHPDLFASTTHTVTVTPHQGLAVDLAPDHLTTVPFGPAAPNAAPGDTNNGQLQLTDAAYTVDITNTSTTSHTFNLSESGLPNGWAILSGAGDGATSTSVALPPGGFGQVGLYISPTLEMLPPAGTRYPFTVHVASPDAPSLDQSAAGTFTVPALSFNHLTADQSTIYSSPGLTTTVALAVRNVGNVAGTFPLSVTEPVSDWTAAITSPLTLDPGQAVTQTITISTPDGALDQDYPVQIASPSGAYTQTVTVNVHLVSPAALKIDQAAQTAARVFPGNRALGAALRQLGQSIETLEAKCAGATVLAPAGQADCATDLRDNVVSSAGQVATDATAASPLITAGAAIQQDAGALSGDTVIGQSQSASSAKARAALAEQAASAGGSTGTVLGDIAVLQGDIAALQGQLQEIGAHGVYVVINPGRRVVLQDKPALFDLFLTNQGSVTSTYALTLTSSSSTLAISPTVADETVAPGATITVPVTATTSTLGSSSITATIAVADAPDLAPLHDVLGVTAVDALLRVTGVTASPSFVEYGPGGAPAVTARIANVANEPIDGTARVRLLDAGGTEVYSATQPLTISSAIRPIDYALGTITTTNLITGAYTLAVDVLDAQGQIIPRASGTSLLGIGQAVQATSAVSPTIVAPGNVTVMTCISTGLNVSVLGGGAQTPPGGIFLTGHDPSVCGTTATNSTLADITDRAGVSRSDIARLQMHTGIPTTAIAKKNSLLYQHTLSIPQSLVRRSTRQATTLEFTSIRPWIVAHISQQPSLKPNSSNVNAHVQAERVATQGRIRPAYTTSSGYAASDFVTALGNNGAVGPIGLAFDPAGNLFVMDQVNGYLYRFGASGGVASTETQVNATPIGGGPVGITFDRNGHLYLARNNANDVVELNPSDGTIVRTVAQNICGAEAIAQDPISGDLFVSELFCGPIVRISNYTNGEGTVTTYADRSFNGPDGLTIGPDGTIYIADRSGEVIRIAGTNSATPGASTVLTTVNDPDGVAVATGRDPNRPPFILINRNDGTITKADLSASPPTLTDIFSGGSRGDFMTVGPDGCLYADQTSTVVKVTNADGTCSLVPTNHLSYIATIDHSVPLTGVNVLTDTISPVPLTTTIDATNTHLLWQQTLNRSTPITTETFDSLLPNMQPGEVREVASGTAITYTGGNAPGTLRLGALFVTAAHLVALSPPTRTVGLGGQVVYTATLANPTGASLTLTPTVAGLPAGWAAPLAPVTLTAGGQVDVPLTITVPTSAVSGGIPNLLGDHPFAVVVADSAGGQDQAGATLTVGDSGGLTVTPGVAAGMDGDVVTYTATITNAGAITQSYALSLSGLAPSAATLPASVTVPAGGAVDVPFTVTVGGPLGPHPFSLTATSPTSGSRADAVLDVLGDRRVAATLSPARAVGGPAVPVLYRLDITNTATLSDTYGFSVSVPAGWSYQLEANGRPADRLSLSPYVLNAANLSLVVTPSIDATPGDAPISVTVQSRNDPIVRAVSAAALTVTDRGVQVALQPKHTTLAPTDSGTWTVAVTNTGSVADTYVLSPTGVIADAARVTPSTLSLAPGQSGTAEIATGPITYGLAQTYGLGVLATSQSDPAIHNADTGDVTFTGNHGVRVALEPGDQTITGTMQTSYLMVISNTGNLDSYYTFTPHSAPGDLDLTPELGRLEVPAHMTSAILLRVRGHRAGTYTLDVRADSTEGGASDTGSATLTIDGSANPSPTAAPTGTATPTSTPTATPSDTATATATGVPTASPTATRTGTPPTPAPTATPAAMLIPSPAALSTVTATPPVIPIAAGATPATATTSPIPAGLTSPRSPLPSTGSPTLRLDRQTVAVGDKLCATGAGFLPGEPIALAVDGYAVAQSVASRDGGFTSCFTMPGVIVEGTNSVSAFGARSLTPAVTLVTGVRGTGSTAYLAGASTARGEDTELDIANPGRVAAFVTFRFYRPNGPSFVRSTTVPGRTRSTFMLSRYLPGVRGFGLLVRSEQVVAAQMIVRRPRANPYTSLGSGLLSTRWYLAEGYTGLTFHETLYLLNPNDHAAHVRVLLLPANGGRARTAPVTVPAGRSAALDVNRAYPHAALAAVATSDRPVYVERVLMFGSGGYGATGNAGAAQATTTWLFAEGSTAHRDQTFLTVLNPGQRPAKVNALFVDARGRVVGGRTIMVNGLHRGTMRLNDTTHAAAMASLVTSDVPVVVERPFYLGNPNVDRAGASLVYGRNGAGSSWTFPAGDTTHGAKEDLLVLNPNPRTLALRATFYLNNRVVVRGYLVPPHARYTLRVNTAARELTNSVHATQLTAIDGRGFVAEQSIYNGDATTIYGTVGMAR